MSKDTAGPPQPPAGPDALKDNKLTVGSLMYTKAGLVVLFGWLLWGDFCFTLFESIGGPGILSTYLQTEFGVSNVTVNVMFNIIPQAIGVIVGPILSFKSDRYRGRMGRRIPFMIWTTPFLCLFAAAIGYSDDILAYVKLHVAEGGWATPLTVGLGFIGFIVVGFSFFNEFVNTVYWYLFADVVPEQYIGRFWGLFRTVGYIAGWLFNVTLAGFQLTHIKEIHVGMAILYFVGFSAMCLRVKEGKYPPVKDDLPERRSFGSRPWWSAWVYRLAAKFLAFLDQVKLYFRECFTHPIFITMYVSVFIAAFARSAGMGGIFSLHLGKHVATVQADDGPVHALAMTPAGDVILTGGEDGRMQLWGIDRHDKVRIDRHDKLAEARTLSPSGPAATSAAMTPDGKTAFAGAADGGITQWNLADGQEVRKLEGHQGAVPALAVSPDGARLASGGADKTVRLWDTKSGECLQTLPGHTDEVRCVAFSSDGKRLASGGLDKTVRLWDAAAGGAPVRTIELVQTDKDKPGPVYALAFAPSLEKQAAAVKQGPTGFVPLDWVIGRALWVAPYLVDVFSNESLYDIPADRRSRIVAQDAWVLAGGQDDGQDSRNARVRVYNSQTGEQIMSLKGHKQAVTSVQYKPDIRMFLSASRDRQLRLWDPTDISSTATDQSFKTYSGYTQAVTALAAPDDGRQVVTASDDGKLHLWNIDAGISLRKGGIAASFFLLVNIIIAYPLGFLVDRWHAIRITIFAAMAVMPIPFISFFIVHDYISNVSMEVFKVPLFALASAAFLPLLISLFPKEKFGQMSSARGLIDQASRLALGFLGAVFMDYVTQKTLLTDNFRYGYLWSGVGFVLYAIALWALYVQWKKLGGDKNYVAPESEAYKAKAAAAVPVPAAPPAAGQGQSGNSGQGRK